MNIPLDATSSREGYLDWLNLASHEYFHAWNGKRLRPAELGPFDYENEVYTRALWFVEGITEYYADLFLVRAGVATRDEYLDALSEQIRSLQTTPGRLEQSAEAASYDAWIKYYRTDENSPNTSISYYVKGAVIGFLLDANIRRLTAGSKSLDDVMHAMFAKFSSERGFSGADFRASVADAVGAAKAREMRAWLARALETTAELDYADALAWFGLRMTPPAGTAATVSRRGDTNRERQDHRRRHSPRVAGRRCRRVVAGRDCGDQRRAGAGRTIRRAACAVFTWSKGDAHDHPQRHRTKY